MTVLGLVLLAAVTAACSQSAASAPADPEPTDQPQVAAAAPTATREAPGSTAAPTMSEPEASEQPIPAEPSEESTSDEDLLALGEEVYQRTAGGIGCQACHGPDGKGDIGPLILGKSAETIATQLETNEAMQFIILSDGEILAIAAYLEWLESQPQP